MLIEKINGGEKYNFMDRRNNSNFPWDNDTLSIIKEIERYLGLQPKNIMILKNDELHEYINKLTLLVLNLSVDDHKRLIVKN